MKTLNEVPTGVMFHHFHSEHHPVSQGSIDAKQFDQLIKHLKNDFNLLTASEWLDKALNNKLENSDTCLTFDDTLKCQTDVALPVMEEHNIEAFWFLCSSFLRKDTVYLEIFRHFRTVCYPQIDDFYDDFFTSTKNQFPNFVEKIDRFNPKTYLEQFPFYSDDDRLFRFIRDQLMTFDQYQEIMLKLIELKNYDVEAEKSSLWFSVDDANYLLKHNHIIGLHSDTHPTQLCKLSEQDQLNQYQNNYNFIKEHLNHTPTTMSHPCNSYDHTTNRILADMGIKIGFRSNMNHQEEHGPLEYAREDHANLIRKYSL